MQITVVSSICNGTTLVTPSGWNIFNPDLQYIVVSHLAEGLAELYVFRAPTPEQMVRSISASPQIKTCFNNGSSFNGSLESPQHSSVIHIPSEYSPSEVLSITKVLVLLPVQNHLVTRLSYKYLICRFSQSVRYCP